MHRSPPPGVTSRRPVLRRGGTRRVRRRQVMLACVIFAVAVVISFSGGKSPPAPNPGPVPEYVKKLETVTVKLPGGVPLEMVRIGAGSFRMGSPESELDRFDCEGPVHKVDIKYDFYIGRYEVTQAQWLAVMGRWPVRVGPWQRINAKLKREPILSEPNRRYGEGANYPAYLVSWNDCQAFIEKLNRRIRKTGQGPATFRLPSEAEWEYACRGGTVTRYYFGDSLEGLETDDLFTDGQAGVLAGKRSDYIKFGPRGHQPYSTLAVGSKLPNQFGLYDMHGNVFEWCQDKWHHSYRDAPCDGRAWDNPARTDRSLRGGSFRSQAVSCRSAYRSSYPPGYRSETIGFRLVRSCEP